MDEPPPPDQTRAVDPLSQAVLGAAAAQSVVGERLGRRSWWLGALGGMAPDLDVLIRNAANPLLSLEYHRHFTHSLAFIPVGGLLVALPFLALAREQTREQRGLIVAATTIGYATHGILDAFTSYGTLLWWPFSRTRVAFDWISVVDPIYTVILAAGVVIAAARSRTRAARAALLVSTLYLGLCGIQHTRATRAQATLAEQRGHERVRGRVQPLLLTSLLWRSLYEDGDGWLHADALSVPWWSGVRHHGTGSRAKLVDADAGPDLKLFLWFTSDWAYEAPELAEGTDGLQVVCDARYSLRPEGFDPLFCVDLGPDGAQALRQARPDDPGPVLREMFAMLGRDAGREL